MRRGIAARCGDAWAGPRRCRGRLGRGTKSRDQGRAGCSCHALTFLTVCTAQRCRMTLGSCAATPLIRPESPSVRRCGSCPPETAASWSAHAGYPPECRRTGSTLSGGAIGPQWHLDRSLGARQSQLQFDEAAQTKLPCCVDTQHPEWQSSPDEHESWHRPVSLIQIALPQH